MVIRSISRKNNVLQNDSWYSRYYYTGFEQKGQYGTELAPGDVVNQGLDSEPDYRKYLST